MDMGLGMFPGSRAVLLRSGGTVQRLSDQAARLSLLGLGRSISTQRLDGSLFVNEERSQDFRG